MNIAVKLLSVCLLLSISALASAQDKPRWEQLSKAYGFVLGQNMSLELIEKKFPDFANEAKQASSAFNSSIFGECAKGVESEMAAFFGDKWPEMKRQIAENIQKNLEAKELSTEEVKTFIKDVQARSKGKSLDDVRPVLLSANPRFVADPALEMSEGWTQIFSTKGLPKAKGIKLSFSLPASWTVDDNESPMIIKMFKRNADNSAVTVLCNLIINEIPLPPDYQFSKEELNDIFKASALAEMTPEGAKIIEAKPITIEGEPAGFLIFDHTEIANNITVNMRATQYVFIRGKTMIIIQFAITKNSLVQSDESFDSLQKKYMPLFEAVGKTIKTK